MRKISSSIHWHLACLIYNVGFLVFTITNVIKYAQEGNVGYVILFIIAGLVFLAFGSLWYWWTVQQFNRKQTALDVQYAAVRGEHEEFKAAMRDYRRSYRVFPWSKR